MDVVAAVGADEESAAVVEPGEGAFDDPAMAPKAGAVVGLAAGDDRLDASLPDEAAVLVVVVAAVGDQRSGSASWPADPAAHGRHPVDGLRAQDAGPSLYTRPRSRQISLTGCRLDFRT